VALSILSTFGAGLYVPTWPELRQTVLQLTSEEGTAQLFKDNARLGGTYAGAERFGETIAKWRGRVLPLPANRDELDPAITTVAVHPQFDNVVVMFTFHSQENAGGLTFLKLTYDGKSLAKVDFFRGFLRNTGAPNADLSPSGSGMTLGVRKP
jgi:hypothetical protein